MTFANGDPLNINQSGAAKGNIKYIIPGGAPTAVRIWAVTYFVEVPPAASGQPPRLMRQVNGQAPAPVADNIIGLKVTYDLCDGTNGPNCSNVPNALAAPFSPSQVHKVNIQIMGQTLSSYGNKSRSTVLATSVSTRSLSFKGPLSIGDLFSRRSEFERQRISGLRSSSKEIKTMSRAKGRSQGFTLIAALLVLALLSAIAVSLLFMVHGAGKVGGNDLETNRAYYGAESGMELLTANLAALYQQSQAPTPVQITNLTNSPPDNTMISSMAYQESITWTPDANGNPASKTSVISSGPSAGLTAEIIPLTLKVAATRPGGASVNMTRGVEVALIPVFQFGVFSDSDLSYFAGPPFAFQGRVHTNGNLFLAANAGPLVLDAKVTAVKQIIRDRLANNYSSAGAYTGDVYVPNQNGGCDPPMMLPPMPIA